MDAFGCLLLSRLNADDFERALDRTELALTDALFSARIML
jgi:hypothetical protein